MHSLNLWEFGSKYASGLPTDIVAGLKVRELSVAIETPLHPHAFNALMEIWYLGVYDNLDPGSGGVVLDAGANVGDFTLRASGWVGKDGLVVAVEPLPHFLQLLRRNLARNRISNVIVVPKAIDDRKGTVRFGGNDFDTIGIDELLSDLGISRVDSVKLDIEGAEESALRGGSNAAKLARHFAVETHSKELDETVSRILVSEGYVLHRPSFPELGIKMGHALLSNPLPFASMEFARLRSWNLTKGPFLLNIPRWLAQKRSPEWFSQEGNLKLLTADRF